VGAVELLVNWGADLNRENSSGELPLFMAIQAFNQQQSIASLKLVFISFYFIYFLSLLKEKKRKKDS
jgi:hypothetical protein